MWSLKVKIHGSKEWIGGSQGLQKKGMKEDWKKVTKVHMMNEQIYLA